MRKMIRFSILSLLVVLVTFMVGCQKAGNYYDVIPSDVSGVVAVNINNLMKKGDITPLLQAQLKQIAGEGAVIQKLEQILADGSQSGLALDENVYLFGIVEPVSVGVVVKVTDETKLKELFVSLKEQGICEDLVKKDGYNQVILQQKTLCVFDAGKLLIMPADVEGAKVQAIKWMEQKAENSIASTENFKQMQALGEDVNFLVAMGAVYNNSIMKNAGSMMPVGIDITKLNLLGGLSFQDGKVNLNIEYTSNDKAALEEYKKQVEYYGKLNNVFLNCFPAASLLYTTANINGEKLYGLLEKYKVLEKLNMNQQPGMPDMQKLIGSFNGDFTLGLMSLSQLGIPSIALYAEVKDDYLVQTLAGLKDMFGQYADFKSTGENTYEVNIRMMNMNIWFGMQDKYFYLTNDPTISTRIGQKVENPLGESKYATALKGAYSGLIINVDAAMQLPVVEMAWGMAGVGGPVLKDVFSGLDYIEIYATSPLAATLNIYLKNKEENALKIMIDKGQQIASAQ